MYPDIQTIKSILLKENYISEADSKLAEAGARDGSDYVAHLIQQDILTKNLLGQAIAESYGLSFVDLQALPLGDEVKQRIPQDIAKGNRVIFIKEQDDIALVVTDQPKKINSKEVLAAFPGKKVRLAYTLPEYIDANLGNTEQPLETRFSKIIEQGQRVAPEIVSEIIKDALAFRASDIHFEPQVEYVLVRFRVDGNLRDAGHVPKAYYDNILNRIKVESGMRIDEHFSAQDGSIRHKNGEGRTTDLRVSLVPTVEGEKIVMRVLGSYIQDFQLSDIGLGEKHRSQLVEYANKPFGMILTVGPTGSGKTTTLYSLLKMLNKPNVNITSIEDPVEYKIAGVNQIQVREQSGLTFAKGLRSIVRQDPDVILVGEIRDEETANISINAALTGHLLLSTFHANDAATAVPRLVDIGVEPFLLASTLELVIAQRLARKICTHCRASIATKDAIEKLPPGLAGKVGSYFTGTQTVYTGKGCTVCGGTGYNGRIALFEFLQVTPEMQELIAKNPSTKEIAALAHRQGADPMFVDGVQKVKEGLTTIAEVLRVVEPPANRTA